MATTEYEKGYLAAVWDISEQKAQFKPEETEYARGYNTAMNDRSDDITEFEED